MSLPFDPSELNVKNVLDALDGLSDEELDALYEAELDGKARTSLLDGLTAAREALRAPTGTAALPAPAGEPRPFRPHSVTKHVRS